MDDNQKELREAEGDLKIQKSLELLGTTDGGKILIENLTSDIVNGIEFVTRQCKDMPETELRVELAKIGINLGIMQALSKAKSNVETLEEIIKSLSN